MRGSSFCLQLVLTLSPGLYSTLVEGKGAATGIAMVEIYELAE